MSHKANKLNMPARSRLRSLLLALASSCSLWLQCAAYLAPHLAHTVGGCLLRHSHALTCLRSLAAMLSRWVCQLACVCICVCECAQFILICLSRRLCNELICDFETIKLWARKRRKKQRILILFLCCLCLSSLICCQIHVCVCMRRVLWLDVASSRCPLPLCVYGFLMSIMWV